MPQSKFYKRLWRVRRVRKGDEWPVTPREASDCHRTRMSVPMEPVIGIPGLASPYRETGVGCLQSLIGFPSGHGHRKRPPLWPGCSSSCEPDLPWEHGDWLLHRTGHSPPVSRLPRFLAECPCGPWTGLVGSSARAFVFLALVLSAR